MKTLPAAVVLGLVLAALASGRVWADHCPEEKIASGAPETSVAGIDLEHDRVQGLLARLGKPEGHEEGTEPDYPKGSGWAEYKWKRASTRINVSTEFYTSDAGARVESVEVVQLSGEPSTAIRGTGRGLSLGQQLPDVVNIYGTKYVDGTVNGPELGAHTVTYCFSDETELSIGLDSKERVVAIRLMAPVE